MSSMSDDPKDAASPACLAHEAGDAYMGFAARDELVSFLNTLLEAERAGARICQRTAHEASQSEKTGLLSERTGLRRSRGHNQPVDLERSRLDARDQVAPELGRVGNRFKAADQE